MLCGAAVFFPGKRCPTACVPWDMEGNSPGGVYADEMQAQGGLCCSLHSLKGGCTQVGIGLFSQGKSSRTRGSCCCHHQEMFKLDIRDIKDIKVVRHWNRQPREVMESLCL